MTKKTAHIILFVIDLLGIAVLLYGCNDFLRILAEVKNQPDSIRFLNRAGFFIFGIGAPIFHLYSAVEYLLPAFCKNNKPIINKGIVAMILVLFSAGFFGSYWIKAQVENGGYIYCSEASGLSALCRPLVYTRSMDICEKLVETKRKRQE